MLRPGVRAPFVLRGIVQRQDELGVDRVVLHDRDPARLATMTALAGHLCRTWGASFEVDGDDDARAALAGARFVFAARSILAAYLSVHADYRVLT
jgi:6-phospho-beta-glucosidase